MVKSTFFLLAGSALVTAASVCVGFCLLPTGAALPGDAFDKAGWLADGDQGKGPRLLMADRLLASNALLKKTRVEVIDLLGAPPPTEYFSNWDMVYWLGPERGWIRIDSEWLVLRLGADGRVTEARIVRD